LAASSNILPLFDDLPKRRQREGYDKISSRFAGISIYPATNADPWSDHNTTSGNRTHDDRSTACADAARPVNTASADHGVRLRCRQGNEAAYEQ
jgi:hypothetical protein